METSELRVVQADESQLNDLNKLVCALDAGAALKPSQAMRQGLSHFDALNSDCVWLLVAYISDQPVGLAILSRIHKLDARLVFFYLDEFHVVREYQRRGVGKVLLSRCIKLVQALELVGIRLLSRIDNDPAL